MLDWLLGTSHGVAYRKAELKTFVGLHRRTPTSFVSLWSAIADSIVSTLLDIGEDTLNEDEVTIISAVLELSDKPLSLIMTPIEFVYSLSSSTILDQSAVDEVSWSLTLLFLDS